jgi:hypothetical protein
MSLLSRLFGKKPAVRPAPTPARTAETPAPKPPKPDTSANARVEEASVAAAIEAGDANAVARWVLDGSSTRVRQAAAQAITERAQLDQLIPAVRGKDKNVYRILTAKREALLAADRAIHQRETAIVDAVAALAKHADRVYDVGYAGTLARLESRWTAVAADATPEQNQAVAGALAKAREVVDAHARAVEAEAVRQRAAAEAAEQAREQQDRDATAAAAAQAEHAHRLEVERETARAHREAADAAVREVVGLLRQAQAAVDHGGTARAARLRDALRARLAETPSLVLPPWFERKHQELDARIGELQDWRTFTVVPKRAELVQRMEALVGAEMSAEELARQIRRLRDEWRTVHRGAADEPTPEHELFERAAERAFEPCREHFARQAERRRENQARREALLERLSTFAATETEESSDARTLQRVLGEARREWREHAPVDQAVVESLQARFHALLDQLQGRLDADYERNVRARRELIARAATLAADDDTRRAVDEAKGLQQRWKAIGPVPRLQDETLWQEFRAQCDALFQRSASERAAHGAELEANRVRAVALCEEVEGMSNLGGSELAATQRRLEELRHEFDGLPLPRASARDARQRFARAAERCDEALRRQRNEAVRQSWTGLFSTAAAVRAYALGVAQGLPDTDCAALHATAAAGVAGTAPARRAAREVLEQQLAGAAAGAVSVDPQANGTALRLLCVRAELLAGLESPPADLELRREHQMRRLVAAMGQGVRASSSEMEDLALEWLAIGPVDPAVHDALLARFQRCFDTA